MSETNEQVNPEKEKEDGSQTRGQKCPELDLTFQSEAGLSDVNVENVEVGTK